MTARTKRVLIYAVAVLAIMGTLVAIAMLRSSGRAHTQADLIINKPPAVVFEWLSDPGRRKSWQTGIKDAKLLTPPPVRAGSKIAIIVEQNGQEMQTISEVTAFDPPKYMAGQAITDRYEMHTSYDLSATGTGTRLVAIAEVELKGWMARMMAGTIQESAQRKMDTDMKALKAAIEKAT